MTRGSRVKAVRREEKRTCRNKQGGSVYRLRQNVLCLRRNRAKMRDFSSVRDADAWAMGLPVELCGEIVFVTCPVSCSTSNQQKEPEQSLRSERAGKRARVTSGGTQSASEHGTTTPNPKIRPARLKSMLINVTKLTRVGDTCRCRGTVVRVYPQTYMRAPRRKVRSMELRSCISVVHGHIRITASAHLRA